MMWLDVLLFALLAFVVYKVVKRIQRNKGNVCSSGCGSCSANCVYRDLAQNSNNTSPYLTVPKKE